jgi:hypothetical protein
MIQQQSSSNPVAIQLQSKNNPAAIQGHSKMEPKGASKLLPANVVFGRASRDLDHAAIQESSSPHITIKTY